MKIFTDPFANIEEDCIVMLRPKWILFYPSYLKMKGYVCATGSFAGDDEVAKVIWENGDTRYYETTMLVRVVED